MMVCYDDLVFNKSSSETVSRDNILPQSISEGALPGLLMIEMTFFLSAKSDTRIFVIAVATSALSQSPDSTSLRSKIIPFLLP